MTVNHQHLRAFHAIASEANVSRAARRLNVAQPTLSQQLKALEERHQVSLFENRKPPLRLTAAGRELFALTQRLFAASSVIDEFLCEEPNDRPIPVRLGSDSPIYAARLVTQLRQQLPEIVMQVRIGNAPETLRALREAQVDVAVVSDPPGENHYTYEPLFTDRLMVALPIDHPLARRAFFPVAALKDARLLAREPSSRTRTAVEHLLSQAEIAPAEVFELHTRETIREGVALGLGVGVFISSECPPDPRIAYVPLEETPGAPKLAGYVVYLTERRRTRLMRAITSIAEHLRRESPIPLDRPQQTPRSERRLAVSG